MAYARSSTKNTNFSIVDYCSSNGGNKCGYCGSSDTSISEGMWAYEMTVLDYQALLDRGWRRSGQYLYKPSLRETCCALYTIKCGALDIKLSKSQKKILKKMNRFLEKGERFKSKSDSEKRSTHEGNITGHEPFIEGSIRVPKPVGNFTVESVVPLGSSVDNTQCQGDVMITSGTSSPISSEPCSVPSKKPKVTETKFFKPGVGADERLPRCKKAKLIRLEKKQQKLAESGESANQVLHQRHQQGEKSLEDFLQEPETVTHRLRVELVRSQPRGAAMERTLKEELKLYQLYQMTIHGDPIARCTEMHFKRFLVNSPLQAWSPNDSEGPEQGYGSFHQQYWLDDKLIAVGVLDVLPNCVSSVYFFYDPEYSDLSLGTYGALREVALTRELHRGVPDLKWYYMGFYIHTCPKMRYKAGLSPSYLLCPEAFTWHPVEKCLPMLDQASYCRFEPDRDLKDPDGDIVLDMVTLLWKKTALPYRYCKMKHPNLSSEFTKKAREYASLVGRKCAENMLLLVT